jgi:hypothetical protein
MPIDGRDPPAPTLEQLRTAELLFPQREPRALVYRVVLELIRLAESEQTQVTTADAVAVLLLSWTSTLFRFNPARAAQLHSELTKLLSDHRVGIDRFRGRSIASLTGDDHEPVALLFDAFDATLGPVGAAKALHMLAPRFFPIWDDAIRNAYHVAGGTAGTRSRHYLRFVEQTKTQITQLGGQHAIGRNPLKALDEFNYGRYTQKWPELLPD